MLGRVGKPLKLFVSEVHGDISVNTGSRNAHHLSESFSVIGVLLEHKTRPTL